MNSYFTMASGATINRAVVYSNPGTIESEVVELPISEPQAGEVLIRLLYSGVCHTDYGICTNAFSSLPSPTPKGQIGGHEGVGEVVRLGNGVQSPTIGSIVGVKWSASACLSCGNCLRGGETTCSTGTISGYFTPGTFQQFCISPAIYVTPIPAGLDLAGVAPLMCGGITVYTALKRSGIKQGEWLLVSGAGGGLGHLAIQYGKAAGARVLALDTSSKSQFCLDLGADAFVDYTQYATDEELKRKVWDITTTGAKVVLMCSSANRAYDQAIPFLGFRGTLVCLGVPEGKAQPIAGAQVQDMINLELSIFASKSGNRLDAVECLEVAALHKIRTHYELRPMEDLSKIFKDMEDGKINGRIVLDLWRNAS